MTFIRHGKQEQQSTYKELVMVYMFSADDGSSNTSMTCLGTLQKEVKVAEVLAPRLVLHLQNFPLQILVRCRFRKMKNHLLVCH